MVLVFWGLLFQAHFPCLHFFAVGQIILQSFASRTLLPLLQGLPSGAIYAVSQQLDGKAAPPSEWPAIPFSGYPSSSGHFSALEIGRFWSRYYNRHAPMVELRSCVAYCGKPEAMSEIPSLSASSLRTTPRKASAIFSVIATPSTPESRSVSAVELALLLAHP